MAIMNGFDSPGEAFTPQSRPAGRSGQPPNGVGQPGAPPEPRAGTHSSAWPDTASSAQPEGTAQIAAHKRPALSQAQQLAIRAELGTAGKGSATLKINVHHYRNRLERLAQQIPDFASFRKMVIDDLREFWHYDRAHKTTTTGNQAEQWKRLFPYWARRVGERRHVSIRALGHSGSYACDLVEPSLPDVWEKFFDAGISAGVAPATLYDAYLKHKDAPVKTIRAGRKFSRRGTGQMVLPGTSKAQVLSEFGAPGDKKLNEP